MSYRRFLLVSLACSLMILSPIAMAQDNQESEDSSDRSTEFSRRLESSRLQSPFQQLKQNRAEGRGLEITTTLERIRKAARGEITPEDERIGTSEPSEKVVEDPVDSYNARKNGASAVAEEEGESLSSEALELLTQEERRRRTGETATGLERLSSERVPRSSRLQSLLDSRYTLRAQGARSRMLPSETPPEVMMRAEERVTEAVQQAAEGEEVEEIEAAEEEAEEEVVLKATDLWKSPLLRSVEEKRNRYVPGGLRSQRLRSQTQYGGPIENEEGIRQVLPSVGRPTTTIGGSAPRFHRNPGGDASRPDFSYQYEGPRRYSIGEFEYGDEESYQGLPYYRRFR